MNRLEKTLASIIETRANSRRPFPALMTHVVLGYPSLKASIDIVLAMAGSGAKIIELQIPFSDPMADGPTIMAANEAALAKGVKVSECMKAAEKLASKTDVPLLFMSYYNILYQYKAGKAPNCVAFCKDAASAGVQGLIVPDVPVELRSEYWDVARDTKLAAIPIVTPVSTPSRLQSVKRTVSGGFIYCVTTTGTTGVRKALPKDTADYMRRIRKSFSQPLALGFGISSREQIKECGEFAEIAIVGSAVVEKIRTAKTGNIASLIGKYVHSLASV